MYDFIFLGHNNEFLGMFRAMTLKQAKLRAPGYVVEHTVRCLKYHSGTLIETIETRWGSGIEQTMSV